MWYNEVMVKVLRNSFVVFVAVLATVFLTSCVKATDSTDVNPKVTVRSALTVSLPEYSTVDVDLDASTESLGQQDITITMSTNNPTGYTMYINSVDGNTDLVNTVNPIYRIPNLTTTTDFDSFPVNYWGYRFANNAAPSGDYGPFVDHSIVSYSDGPVSKNVSTIGLGTKVDYSIPAGLYQMKFNFEVIPTITQNYMQNLDSSVCKSVPTVVIDQRDEQLYLIQRLSDGKCWMLDNLNLDLTNTTVVGKLSTTNTNANAAALTSLRTGNRGAGAQYANAGLTMSNWDDADASYATPLVNKGGNCTTTSAYPCAYDGSYTNYTKLSALAPGSSFGEEKHSSGKVGMLYNYCAATAGSYCYDNSGTNAAPSNTNAQYDICPAGWKMPSADEFQGICDATLGSNCDVTENTPTNNDKIQSELAVNFAGFYYPMDVLAQRQGNSGYVWSSTWGRNVSAIPFSFVVYGNSVYTHNTGSERYIGQTVRCILNEP